MVWWLVLAACNTPEFVGKFEYQLASEPGVVHRIRKMEGEDIDGVLVLGGFDDEFRLWWGIPDYEQEQTYTATRDVTDWYGFNGRDEMYGIVEGTWVPTGEGKDQEYAGRVMWGCIDDDRSACNVFEWSGRRGRTPRPEPAGDDCLVGVWDALGGCNGEADTMFLEANGTGEVQTVDCSGVCEKDTNVVWFDWEATEDTLVLDYGDGITCGYSNPLDQQVSVAYSCSDTTLVIDGVTWSRR